MTYPPRNINEYTGKVYQLDEDALYKQVMAAVWTGNQAVAIGDYLPLFCGTREERDAIQDAILARAQRDPTFTAGAWKQTIPRNSTKHYAVRGNDGRFHNRTMEQITAALIQGETSTLEVQGSIQEQRQFFAAVRQHISTIQVVQGKNVKEHGAVTFIEPSVQKALTNVDELEAMFEGFVLNSMQPVAEETDLAKALDGMDME